jgi:hypothetical protein
MSGLGRRASGNAPFLAKPIGKYIRRDILDKSSQTFLLRSRGRLHPVKLLWVMSASHVPVVEAILRDDVFALGVWSMGHRDFVVDFDGHNETEAQSG